MHLFNAGTVTFAAGCVTISSSLFFGGNLAGNLCNCCCPCVGRPNPVLDAEIQRLFGDFLAQHYSGRPIQVVETFMHEGEICGDSHFPTSVPVIRLPDTLLTLDPSAYGYLFKYQFSQIKYHDPLVANLIGFLITGAGAGLQFYPSFANIAQFAACVGGLATYGFMRYQYNLALEFSAKYSSDEELKGGLCYYVAEREWALDMRKRACIYRLITSSEGNSPPNLKPSRSKQLQSIIHTLYQRNIYVKAEQRPDFKNKFLRFIDSALLLNVNREVFDLDSFETAERIATLKGIVHGNNKTINV